MNRWSLGTEYSKTVCNRLPLTQGNKDNTCILDLDPENLINCKSKKRGSIYHYTLL